jgi:hypothetical protein
MKEAQSLDGIISYLTNQHGGNVHEKGLVAMTSKLADDFPARDLTNIADLTSYFGFSSKDEPGQWVCWDFRQMRVRPTHYTIKSYSLRSWVVEGSMDGGSWTEIDRKTDSQVFKGWDTGSFVVSKPAECRFIRLTQTGKSHYDDDALLLHAVEFFGTLFK